jgi:Skp family chaperone for outer membrane proteins
MKRALGLPAIGLAIAATAIVTHQVIGERPGQPGGCACVVSLNLSAVLEGLNERGEAELELKKMADRMIAEDTQRQESIQALREQATDIPETDETALMALSDRVAQEAITYQAWRLYATEQLDIEKSLMLRDLDRRIEEAVKELAEANGYDIVLLDDSGQALTLNPESKVPREAQVKQQITSQRAMYVSPVADITDELIERMNNAFNTGG